MENKHKQFKSYDKVIVRESFNDELWHCDYYSHWNEEDNSHSTLIRDEVSDSHILPYEGNEHLVGTAYEPAEEIKLEEGEWGFASNYVSEDPKNWDLSSFLKIVEKQIFFTKGNYHYGYFIRFSDFNPYDMKETEKHILCARNGKVMKFNSIKKQNKNRL